ncbi:MAG: molybdenum cofactor guanylyltransferase [Gallionella sp.]|nr:molybdenum cofactor guanylyltransferase [Gallionella sp.]MDD4958140.1 molybdenum cofactor guanylyltransferase [Gallionella sp.]
MLTEVINSTIPDCTALILAGGESRRMGQDKANLLLGEYTLLQHVTSTLQPLFADMLVSVRHPRTDCDLPQICDDTDYAGPLAGLLSGLTQTQTPWLFVVACDMPFISPQLIQALSAYRHESWDAVVPVVDGHPQPLAAFYATRLIDKVRANLNGSGKHSLRALLDLCAVCYVQASELRAADPALHSFFDLDTPEDLALAIGNF